MLSFNGIKVLSLYRKTVLIIINILVFVMLLTLLGAVVGLLIDFLSVLKLLIGVAPKNLIGVHHTLMSKLGHTLVVDILSVFILIELFRTFTDYLQINRIRLSILAEFGFVFVLRDVFIGLYANKLAGLDLIALSVVLAVLAGTRILAGAFPPKEQKGTAEI